ncbi:spermatogenesis-associated protein 16 isoform X2 [Rhinatrema bivittatum]|uniref:spermatogenesis-associated protein 16 isoform X2 n=1 Tax=Rhinatrema bivittatum TaxID=194408 RepID=UPI00112C5E76|nr:spermatogenesis-associated protein 16 isoform X2 [Rhinatrema bivittatum]
MDWELPTEDFFIQHGDRDCLKAMDSAGDKDFESTVNEKCQRETSQKANSSGGVKNIIEEKQLSIPDMLRNVKTSADAQMEENGPERIKATRGLKEKQQTHDPLRAGLKRKSEHEEKLMAKKDPRLLEIENQLVSLPLPRIPLKSVMDVEVKLVFVDEQDISYEFIDSLVSTSTQSTCRAVEIVDSLSAPNFSFLPQIDKWLQVALKDASTCYRQKKYAIAAGRFRTALELCSKGAALGKPFDTSAEDISSVASFIETKLACCYLRMRRPDLALNHAHRSITLNPTHFRNHLRQATVFRSLERYPEAARSAMIADYMYWMSGGSEQHISKLIKLYWQAMIEEAITRAESFSVMYTPFAKKLRAEKTEKVKEIFTKKHPAYAEYIYSEHKTLFRPFTKEEAERHLERLGKRVLPILDFIRCTKLPGSFSACSGVIEKLQYASFLSQSQRGKEESQVINQAMAELATIPYLQDISQQDAELLQSLMADAMDSLEEKRSNKERVWNKIQKVGLIEDYLYQLEDSFLKTKKLRTARRQRMKMKRLQSVHLCQSQENSQPSPRHPEGGSKDINTVEI